MNDSDYADLQARINADIERVSRDYKRKREKKAATKTPRKQSLKAYIDAERSGVLRREEDQ